MTTCKTFNKKYGKLPANIVEETRWNKMCVDFTGPYKICQRENQPLNLKAVIIIDIVTGWFEMRQYKNKTAMKTENLVDNLCLVRYI